MSRGGKREGSGRPRTIDPAIRKYYHAYHTQKVHAGKRGIDWQFDSLEQWIDWWGDDIDKRGNTAGKMQMCRNADQGPYHPDNVRKGTIEENLSERKGRKQGARTPGFCELKRQQAIAQHIAMGHNIKGIIMQKFVTPHPGRTPGPNLVNRDDYKMHVLKRQYHDGEWEILIERWIPETGWSRTQLLMTQTEFDRLRDILAL